MLTDLSLLSIDTDGRYATENELKFLTNYVNSIDVRVGTYKKLCVAIPEIVEKLIKNNKDNNPNLFINALGDVTHMARRDVTLLLSEATAAVLFDDQKMFQEHLLLWHNTITRCFQVDHMLRAMCKVMPQVVAEYLNPDEMAIFSPFISLATISFA